MRRCWYSEGPKAQVLRCYHGRYSIRRLFMSTEVQSNSSTDEFSLAAAFTAEHHDIDAGIEQYLADTAAPDPRQRAVPLQNTMAALRRHIYLEEEIVFPHLPKDALMMPLMVMRKEHGEIWQRMDALEEILQDPAGNSTRSEEHTSELQSRGQLVCRLLLEKKKGNHSGEPA